MKTWIAAAGALGIGTAVGTTLSQYALAGDRRRTLRADVIAALDRVEVERWATPTNLESNQEFNEARTVLRAACVVARVDRDLVGQYVLLATVARNLSVMSLEEAGGDLEVGGGIEGSFAEIVYDAAELLTRVTLSPVRARFRLRARIAALDGRVRQLDDKAVLQRVQWLARRWRGRPFAGDGA